MSLANLSWIGASSGSFTPPAPGSGGGNDGERDLYLKGFAGEILAAFRQSTALYDRTMKKRLTSGKSTQFIAYGRATAQVRQRGESILTSATHFGEGPILNSMNVVERLVGVDDQLVSGTVIDEMDDLMAHYDLRAGFAAELGQALALAYDERAQRVLLRTARTTTANSAEFVPADLGTRGEGGYVQAASDWYTDGGVTDTIGGEFLDSLHEAAKVMDSKGVPRQGRFVLCTPQLYWALVRNKEVLNRDFGETQGVFSQGTLTMAAGFMVIASDHFITDLGDLTTNPKGTSEANDYRNVADTIANPVNNVVQALCWHGRAIGAAELQAPTVQFDLNNVEYQGDIVVAKTMVGFNRLRAESVVEIGTNASQPSIP